jgi:hypothetical protein
MSDVRSRPKTELDAKEATAEANDSVSRLGPASSMVEGSQRLRDFEGVHLTFPPAEYFAGDEDAGTTDGNVLWE